MRWIGLILTLSVFILAGCRDDNGTTDDGPIEVQPATLFVPTYAILAAGCETEDLESWLEAIVVNSRAFRDESFGVATLPPDGVMNAMLRLGSLREIIYQTPVPECFTVILGDLQDFTTNIMDAMVSYGNGQIDQVQLLEIVTREHVIYDEVIKPQLDDALKLLENRQEAK